MLKEQITISLEHTFSQYGFAEPSVAELKNACNVSLRTLYKYYPSKEAMVVGALAYRHQRYLTFLRNESPLPGVEAVLHIFDKLECWMEKFAPHGCLSMNAISTFPENLLINQAVVKHKKDVLEFLGQQSQRIDMANTIFLIHEGVSNAWPTMREQAVISAKKALLTLLTEGKL